MTIQLLHKKLIKKNIRPRDIVTLESLRNAAAVVVANSAYFGGGMKICPDASTSDGLLDVCVIGDVGKLDLLRSFLKVRTGDHVDHPKVSIFKASEIESVVKWWIPERVEFIEEVPKTSVGKFSKKTLRDQFSDVIVD